MNVGGYIALIKDESSLQILNLCRQPKTTDEIINELWVKLKFQYPSLYDLKSKVTQVVAPRLNSLEILGALEYAEGSWLISDEAINYLSKYCGL